MATTMTTMTTQTTISARHASQYRSWIRQQAGLKAGAGCPVRAVPGSSAPRYLGEGFYFTTMAGKPIYYPNAYKWPKNYWASTRRVEVGAEWLASRCIPADALVVARRVL